MIVKFVYYPMDQPVREHLVECADLYFTYKEDGETALFDLTPTSPVNKDNTTVVSEVDCETTTVYVMNDQGKTIDSYRWKRTDGKIHRI